MHAYVFISYSRNDVAFITPIVRLLRTAIAGVSSASGNQWKLVFQDIDNIDPGGEWEKKIDEAIARAERMFVFWCTHSATSNQVRREYELGFQLAKVVVPVLLDDTPLPADLSRINGVDLRGLRVHGPQLRQLIPDLGVRSPREVIIREFAQALDMDAQSMDLNLIRSVLGH